MNTDELMITLPSTASLKCYPNNKPSYYRVLLPTPLELDGPWELAIASIQYPFNWPNFEETHVAFIIKLEDEEDQEYYKTQCKISQVISSQDPKHAALTALTANYITQTMTPYTDFKVVIMPTGYYQSPEDIAEYLVGEFNKMFKVTGYELRQPCRLSFTYDPITEKIFFEKQNISIFRLATLNKNFHNNIGSLSECFQEKLFLSQPNPLQSKKSKIDKLSSLYIYCDVIKYQIVGDIQAPLLATLPIQGCPNDQCYWAFQPPYYIPVNQKSISSIEIKICTEYGDLFPFGPYGRVVTRLHFRRQRGAW
jgi:hypothetical protein